MTESRIGCAAPTEELGAATKLNFPVILCFVGSIQKRKESRRDPPRLYREQNYQQQRKRKRLFELLFKPSSAGIAITRSSKTEKTWWRI
jgi:hypothetical protein